MHQYARVLAILTVVSASRAALAETIHHPMVQGGTTHVAIQVEPLAECRLQASGNTSKSKGIWTGSAEDGYVEFDVTHFEGPAPKDMVLVCGRDGQIWSHPLAFDLTDHALKTSRRKRTGKPTPMPSSHKGIMEGGTTTSGWSNNWAGAVMSPLIGTFFEYAIGTITAPSTLGNFNAPVIPNCTCPSPTDPAIIDGRTPIQKECDTFTTSSTWVGIGNSEIIQAGAEDDWLGHHDCSFTINPDGTTGVASSWTVFKNDYLWYEYFPSEQVFIRSIAEGETFTVSVMASDAYGNVAPNGGYGDFFFSNLKDGSTAEFIAAEPSSSAGFTGSQTEWIVEKTKVTLCDDFGQCDARYLPPLTSFDNVNPPSITNAAAFDNNRTIENLRDTPFKLISMCTDSTCSKTEAFATYVGPFDLVCNSFTLYDYCPDDGSFPPPPCCSTLLPQDALTFQWVGW